MNDGQVKPRAVPGNQGRREAFQSVEETMQQLPLGCIQFPQRPDLETLRCAQHDGDRHNAVHNVSVTDACIDWITTEKCILATQDSLYRARVTAASRLHAGYSLRSGGIRQKPCGAISSAVLNILDMFWKAISPVSSTRPSSSKYLRNNATCSSVTWRSW
jgi:hypothetical protein